MTSPTRNVRYDITVSEHTAGADRASGALGKVDKSAQGAGRSMRGMGQDAKILNGEIEASTARVKALNHELLNLGNDRAVRQRLRAERSWLAELRKIEKDMTAARPLAYTVPISFAGIGEHLGAIGGKAAPILIGSIVGALVAAMPTIGAVVAGGLAGALGTGAMALGIITAAKDERVRAAARQFGGDISREFFRGDAFVKPIINALAILRQGFRDLHLAEALTKIAPVVEVIADGFVLLAKNVMPGFNLALDRMRPFAEAARKGLAETGNALSILFDAITRNKGSVEGLSTLFHLLNGTLILIGGTVNWLSGIYERWVNVQRVAFGLLQGIAIATGNVELASALERVNVGLAKMNDTGSRTEVVVDGVTVGIQSFGQAADLAAVAQGRLNSALDKGHQAFLNFMGADIAAEAALDRFTEGVREHGRSLDKNTEIGRENLSNLLEISRAAQDAAQKKYDETKSVEQANAVYEQYRQRLEQQLRILGYNKAEIQNIIDQWFGLAQVPDITKNVTIKTHGLDNVWASLNALGAAIVGATIATQVPRRAAGGPVQAGHVYMVGEQGPEPFIPATNGYILPNSALSGGPTQVQLSWAGGMGSSEFERMFVPWILSKLRAEVRGLGGAQAAFS